MFEQGEEEQKALEWFQGDRGAVEFVAQISEATQIGDDLVDEKLPYLEKAALMTRLFERLLTLNAHPFYAQHYAQLCPLILTGVFEWETSNEWQLSDKEETRIFGYVRREALESLIVYVAYLIGGADWAMKVGRDVHQFYHIDHADGETVATWSTEHGQQ